MSQSSDDEALPSYNQEEILAFTETELDDALKKLEQRDNELKVATDNLSFLELRAKEQKDDLQEKLGDALRTIQRMKKEASKWSTERAGLVEDASKRATLANAKMDRLSEKVLQKEAKIQDLTRQKDSLNGHLKNSRADAVRPRTEDSSLDLFRNKVDQVSEADIKRGVESLNDSVFNFVMTLIDLGDETAQTHADFQGACPEPEHPSGPLFDFLATPNLAEEARGLLLDALFHNHVVLALHELFFQGQVTPQVAERGMKFEVVLDRLTEKEPWTVAQRWRAITATCVWTDFDSSYWRIKECTEMIVNILSWAYRLPHWTFAVSAELIHSRLQSVYNEASQLAISCRRDVLSVRMSVAIAPQSDNGFDPFDPDRVASVWPEMGASAGDGIIGMYKFGLRRLSENGALSFLLQPEVATTALLREMGKQTI
ncbi:hypothetical protein C8J57DRAFT_121190 [Mycena rebaudengoi]|nr:hypothetical protein C8J57DRAFT_121190 [Mycena rebaudengoi]